MIIYDKKPAIVRCLPRRCRRNRDEHHGAPGALGLDQPFGATLPGDYQVSASSILDAGAFGNTGDYARDVATLEASLDFLAANKITCISVAATRKEGGGATAPELRAELKTMQKIGQLCKPYGISPNLHPHINTLIMFEKDVDFIMRNTNPSEFSFGPDTAHLTLGLCDPVEIFDRYKTRIRFVHLKDVKKRKAGTGERDIPGGFKIICSEGNDKQGIEVFSDFLELGEGEVNFAGVFKILASVDYDSYLTCELDSSRFGNKQSAAMNLKYLRAHGFN